MTNSELRLRVQSTIYDWIFNLKEQNKISASVIEDALNKVLVKIKEDVFVEYLIEQQEQAQQEEEKNAPKEEDHLAPAEILD